MPYTQFLQNPIVKGAISGLVGAAAVDIHAFREWKSFDDATKYDWKVAAWRWLQGIVVGGLTAAGLGAF